MDPIKIALVSLGHHKQPIDLEFLSRWKSRIFSIRHGEHIAFTPNAEGKDWEYTDNQIRSLVNKHADSDVTVAVISAQIQDDYYSRRLGDNLVVFSLHEMSEIVLAANYRVEHFLIRNIYQIAIYYRAWRGSVKGTGDCSWTHHDTRGCLFDTNPNKTDILYSMRQPKLCESCRANVQKHQLPSEFLSVLESELAKLQRGLFYRIVDLVKAHPIYSILVTAAFGIALNIVASIIFEKSKHLWPWLTTSFF